MMGRRHKFNARPAFDTAGRWYASTAERDYGAELALLEQAGAIAELTHQPVVELEPGVRYKPDYRHVEPNGRVIFTEVKGVEGERFRLLCALWRLHGPGTLRVVKRPSRNRGFVVTREILPHVVTTSAQDAAVSVPRRATPTRRPKRMHGEGAA